ncbi:unnamed protein product [Prunus armeniaca]
MVRHDRGLCNFQWRLLFLEACVRHLAKAKSDHCPLLLQLDPSFRSYPHLKPFHFEAMWLKHEGFQQFVANFWGQENGNLLNKTKELSKQLKIWNSEVFGHLKLRKRRVLARIAGAQKCWEICGVEVCDLVKQVFTTGEIPYDLTRTLIVLVPKVTSPLSMTQMRPISLCNTLYKTISKILVSRLRPLLKNLISPNQASFIPGRLISDNIVLAQELLHKFRHFKGKNGFVAWKIDLSKAYDRINCGFLEFVLREI